MGKFWQLKIKNNFLIVLASPWFLALIPTIIISLLLPELFNKYNLSLQQQEDREKSKHLTFFEDVTNDGVKDNIDILNYGNLFACCSFQQNNSLLKEQFNFYGKLPDQENLNTPIFNDVNNDGIKELFVFTQKADSLFLNAVDFKTSKIIVYGRFVTTIGTGKNVKDFVLRPIINHDNNNDGVAELYFLINAGYALVPRKIMAYDFVNDTFISSINTGSQHFVVPFKTDDNKLILISKSKATDNCPPDFPFPYNDNSSRIFGFNDKLEFIFEPISFNGITTQVSGPLPYANQFHFYVLNETTESSGNFVLSINTKGKILKKVISNKTSPRDKVIVVKKGEKKHYIIECFENNMLKFYEYNPSIMKLEETKVSKSLPIESLINFSLHTNTDAFIGTNYKTNTASLYLDNFKQQLNFGKNLYLKSWNFYAQTKPIKNGQLLMVTDQYFLYTYLLTNTKYYPFRFLLFFVIYLLSVGFVYLPQKLGRRIVLKREKLQKEITALQLQLVNSKLDPHFTFNALNTVSAKVLKGERFEAYDLMTNFSSLMRSAMFFSDKDSWDLSEELKFTESYLILMKSRFSKVFNFVIEVEENLDTEKISIPRLLLQNFAENAIKHAFVNISYQGVLKIAVKKTINTIIVTIEDNGIGREKAQQNSEKDTNKSGKGIRLNKKQVQIYNQLYKTNITLEIFDLFDNNTSSGTKISIAIPT
ncbi:histidine kinase [Lutibacter sp.]|uniref:histidine kinase n=1 Tax=Lutibacter sp. TaxID=1925666 RepID=UPI003562721D